MADLGIFGFSLSKRSGLTALLLVVIFTLGGCAANVTKPTGDATVAPLALTTRPTAVALVITGAPAIESSADWQTFRAEWRTAFNAAAGAAGVAATYFEAEPADQPPGAVLIRVRVNEYRYLTPGARFGLGIMTGNAFIDADAEFVEFPARRVAGKRKYATSSSAWQGVFSAMTDKQVRAISDTMLQELARR